MTNHELILSHFAPSDSYSYTDVQNVAANLLNCTPAGKNYAVLRFLQEFSEPTNVDIEIYEKFRNGDPRKFTELEAVRKTWRFIIKDSSSRQKGVNLATVQDVKKTKPAQVDIKTQLAQIIISTQAEIRKNKIIHIEFIESAIAKLASIGYCYNEDLFPKLNSTEHFNAEAVKSSPNSLAEALLWKMGKWNVYTEFVNNYKKNSHPTKTTNVVFTAFAKHLTDKSKNPIYDQHALRAMLAININFTPAEKNQCKSALFKSNGKKNINGNQYFLEMKR